MTDNLQHQVVADLRARIAELEDRLAGKTQFCQQCEKTERALLKLCGPAHVFLDGEVFPSAMKSLGLWRAPTPATSTEGDQP